MRVFFLTIIILLIYGCESREEKHCKEWMDKNGALILEVFGKELYDLEYKNCLENPALYK